MDEIRPVGKVEIVPIAELNIQYIPVLTPEDIWHETMAVSTSPHVKLMQMFLYYGFDQKRMRLTDYFRERVRRRMLGMKRWTDKYILTHHAEKRYEILKSIKRSGYDKSQPILVLKEPFWLTRFGFAPAWVKGKEIWTGAGRSSACCALGIKEIPVQWVEDTRPGSGVRGRFGKKIPKQVWEEIEACASR